jgi:hypothetical protein
MQAYCRKFRGFDMSDHGPEKKKKKKSKRYDDAYLRDPEQPDLGGFSATDMDPSPGDLAPAKGGSTRHRYRVHLNDGRSLDIDADEIKSSKGTGLVMIMEDNEIKYIFSSHYFMYFERVS